jgi:GMP synthase (glutamine-hydrolysing)
MIRTLGHVDAEVLAEIAEEKAIRQTDELFVLFSLGSQFDHLIKQHLDRLGVYCVVADSARVTAADIKRLAPKGLILSGGPVSVQLAPPPFDDAIFDLGIPTLGICLGFQLWAQHIGATVGAAITKEFGTHLLTVTKPEGLFAGLLATMPVLESHGDRIELSKQLKVLATTENAPVAAARHEHLWGVQFHPEVTETEFGAEIFRNFCFSVCGAKDVYPAADVAERKVAQVRETVGSGRVLLALSGGSDSSVVASILKHALGPGQVRAIYIKGIDRPDDEQHVIRYFGQEDWLELNIVDATDRFREALKGHETMAAKRLAMRGVYKAVLEAEAEQFSADFMAQGTLYTDLSESGGGHQTGSHKAQIKLHHNTGLDFSLPELAPLEDCVKDSARNIGRLLGTPEELLLRHPFPGPGLVVRIEGEVTAENLHMARQLDGIYIEELRKWKLYDSVWQAGAVVTRSITTGSKGDDAASGVIVALWAVWSVNGFTAQWAELPADFLRVISQRITNEIHAVGAVVYRISDKPPVTIEWG